MRKKITSDRLINIVVLILSAFGTLMIASAVMGQSDGDTGVILQTMARQAIFLGGGFFCLYLFSKIKVFGHRRQFYLFIYVTLIIALIIPRFLGMGSYGAYGWIRLGFISIQPSEFAKVFAIVYTTYFLADTKYRDEKEAKSAYLFVMGTLLLMALIIVGWQKDTGSGLIFSGISFFLLMIPYNKAYRKYQHYLKIVLFLIIVAAIVVMLPQTTSFLESLNSDNYIISRFLSSADPFKYQYGIGYHLILSLVASATGGLFGSGYASSIYKYMNFPNTDNDFILPIIIEELGIFGFLFIVVCYGIIAYRLLKYAFNKKAALRSKMVLSGVILYLLLHFIFNVGGVSGIIPLTGVPLLLISSGGSSTVAFLCAIGIAQKEIKLIKYKEAQN